MLVIFGESNENRQEALEALTHWKDRAKKICLGDHNVKKKKTWGANVNNHIDFQKI